MAHMESQFSLLDLNLHRAFPLAWGRIVKGLGFRGHFAGPLSHIKTVFSCVFRSSKECTFISARLIQ